jgi:hypothetical protein
MLTSSHLAGQLMKAIKALLKALRHDDQRWFQIDRAVEILSAIKGQQASGLIDGTGSPVVKGNKPILKGKDPIVKGQGDGGGEKPKGNGGGGSRKPE